MANAGMWKDHLYRNVSITSRQATIPKDPLLLAELGNNVAPSASLAIAQRHCLHRGPGLPTIDFAERELHILTCNTAPLNDVCINGSAALLHTIFVNNTDRCAILSTFDLVKVRNNVSDANLWESVASSQYWLRDMWILPIHREQPGHWVLCKIMCTSRELLLFDSLADREPWCGEIHDIMILIQRLVFLANRHGHKLSLIAQDWVARPLLVSLSFPEPCISHNATQTRACQTNEHDCGLWVLASIGASLRGFHCAALKEQDIPVFRGILHRLITSLPTT
jgi:hypothetical protein